MLIRRMSAVFGKLRGETLELRDGLNILESPNETGKSTWCAFLTAMFYGINSRERDRAGFLAGKNRYAPWQGELMSGRMDVVQGDRELTLIRSTRRPTSPMGVFQALYQGTGDAVEGLTGENCGEVLLGVGREVFVRSALIRQTGLAISQDVGLERRIASLITAGEEDTSYSESAAALKKQLNRRRHNKTGLLPSLEGELRETEERLGRLAGLEQELTAMRTRTEALERQEADLAEELSRHQRWESQRQYQALAQARASAEELSQKAELLRRRLEAENVPEVDAIGRLRGSIVNLDASRRALQKALEEREQAAAALAEAESAIQRTPFAGKTPEEVEDLPLDLPPRPRMPLWVAALGILLGAALGAALYFLQRNLPLVLGCGCGLLGIVLLAGGFAAGRKQAVWEGKAAKARARRQDALEAYKRQYAALEKARETGAAKDSARSALEESYNEGASAILTEVRRFAPESVTIRDADESLRRCAVQRKALAEAESAAKEASLRREFLEKQSQRAAPGEVEESPPLRSREETESSLHRVRGELAAARSAADHLTGRLQAMGDPVLLRSGAERLRGEIAALERECGALRIALAALEESNAALQGRFSPALGRRASEIFAELTGNRYSAVALDRQLHLSAEPAGDALYRDAGYLSTGTVDQLYLAVRLAICELVLPEESPPPIILDDALSSFDDERCEAALRWLRREAERRQILLFTCHSREARFFAGDPSVSIQPLP